MSEREWDVFISHASEDKDSIARPLADKLTKFGVRVWFDEFELKIGDSLSRSIDLGLSNSKFGIVILSESFFSKDWTEYEYRGLVAKSIGKDKTILPVWHNLNRELVLKFSPTLADIMAENTNKSTDQLAVNLLNIISPELYDAVLRKITHGIRSLNSTISQIDPSALKLGPIRHEKLPGELIRRISIIRSALSDIHPISMEEWVDGFQRDVHPSREIRAWEFIASRYLQIRNAVPLTTEQKGQIFSSLLACSMGNEEAVSQNLLKFSSEEARQIIEVLNTENEIFFNKKSEREQDIPDMDYESFSGPEANIDNQYIEELAKIANRGRT